jgi:glutamyl-tRNA reductase
MAGDIRKDEIVAISCGRDAPRHLRERLALSDDQARMILRAPRAGVGEMAVLSTCHRTELYAASLGAPERALRSLVSSLPLGRGEQSEIQTLVGGEAVRHLYRVACGLDSLVIGEQQILGQVRRAMLVAQGEQAAGPVLTTLLSRAIRVGRHVRRQTGLGAHGVSIGSLATGFLADEVGGLAGKHVLIVGAGQAAGDAALHLAAAGAHLTIVSRTWLSAEHLAATGGGVARAIEELDAALAGVACAVVAMSGGHPISFGAGIPVVDVSVPRVARSAGARVVGLEDLPLPGRPELVHVTAAAEALVCEAVDDHLRRAALRVPETAGAAR